MSVIAGLRMFAALAFAAILIEAAAGYPDAIYRRIGHPVTWIGALAAACERAWNRADRAFMARRALGALTLLVLVGTAAAAGFGLTHVATSAAGPLGGLLVTAAVASTLVAQRSLDDHVAAVAAALERDGLDAARRAVSKIVGRDPDTLDEAGVSRAAIESLAENFSDGVVAPLFWLVVAGLPGALVYKAINTADSMIGHKSERYLAFGWAAARTDDLVNLPASRLSALWLALAALVLRGASARDAVRAIGRDASKHRSPNAGWPEAAMAGALGFKLAGPRAYGGNMVDDHFMGDGRADLDASDVRRALALYRVASTVQGAAVMILALVTPAWL